MRDSISTLANCGILMLNKKTKQDLYSLFVTECSSNDNSSQRHNYALSDIAPVDLGTLNCTRVETSMVIDSYKYNNLKDEVNKSNTASFIALRRFVVAELNEIKEK